jgi:hypothetical protein
VASGAWREDRLVLIAATVLVVQLGVTVALTGSDRAHALSHLPAAFVALGALWAVLRRWHSSDNRFELWARRGMVAALCVAATTWAAEAIAALGWVADGYTERWTILTALHDSVLVNISVLSVMLTFIASLTALIALTMRGLRAIRSRHAR